MRCTVKQEVQAQEYLFVISTIEIELRWNVVTSELSQKNKIKQKQKRMKSD